MVVIGTGAGGGTAGFNLARLGRSVLFLERGKLHPPQDTNDIRAHRWPDPVPRIGENMDARLRLGCGLGGSTSLFAMVMDRFRPIDFTPRAGVQVPPDTSLPAEWPIQYEDLDPYYREAEALFRVRGTDDPLAPTAGQLLEPPAPSNTEIAVHDTLKQCGLHSYGVHYACENVAGCDRCISKPCSRDCRNDAARICMQPALKDHGAYILPECHVLKLEATGNTVRAAICDYNGRRIAIRGRIFILALHALLTPALLLRSANEWFPDGLGNRSGMVGRNLMLHLTDMLMAQLETPSGLLNGQLQHGLSLNDFYVRDGFKLGNIHAHARDFTNILNRLPALDESKGTLLFYTILEDFPYPQNRVTPHPENEAEVCWEYHFPNELRERSRMLADALAEALRPMGDLRILQPSENLNITHACGTCRFGNNPRTSVLDRNNRIHDLDNAYVLDGSFFPSSGGIHPSLTIAANSLRVSTLIAQS